MNNLIDLVVLGLAVWRFSNLLSDGDGPYDFLHKIRHWSGVRYDENNHPYGTTELSRGILCVYCNSVWIGAAATIAYLLGGSIVAWLVSPFAFSTFAILLNRVIRDG